MRFLILVIMLSTLLFSCAKIGVLKAPNPKSGLERYVVYNLNPGLTDHAKNLIIKSEGKIHKKMRYRQNAYVAFINPKKIKYPIAEGVVIEQDIIKKASGCTQDPEPTNPPPPDEQPSQVFGWGVERVGAPEAHKYNKGAGIVVCVVDSGGDKEHVDLKGSIIGGESHVENESWWLDTAEHGTFVSGLIAAEDNSFGIVGVAPEAKIFISKVLDFEGRGYASDIASGILGCVQQKVDIINLSLGSDRPSNIIHESIIKAKDAGIIIVAAAGNEASSVGWPAAFDEVIAVSASNERDEMAYFSNSGPEIQFISPGTNNYSTTPGDNYSTMSGTSFSSPIMAGVFALMLSSGNSSIVTEWINLPSYQQGRGLPSALETVRP